MTTTIIDVARAAGVSTATVSRVLNNHPQVDPRLATAKDLGYRPSRVARSLRTRTSRVWTLLISDIRSPLFTDLVRGIEDVAYGAGYSVILGNAVEDLAKEASYLIRPGRADRPVAAQPNRGLRGSGAHRDAVAGAAHPRELAARQGGPDG